MIERETRGDERQGRAEKRGGGIERKRGKKRTYGAKTGKWQKTNHFPEKVVPRINRSAIRPANNPLSGEKVDRTDNGTPAHITRLRADGNR